MKTKGSSGRKRSAASVVATGQWTGPDRMRAPAGEVHAWVPGQNQTLCGRALSRERFVWFSHVGWADVQPATGRHADEVTQVCPRCAAGMGARRGERRWRRVDPRP